LIREALAAFMAQDREQTAAIRCIGRHCKSGRRKSGPIRVGKTRRTKRR
jgi:hypothetical protein